MRASVVLSALVVLAAALVVPGPTERLAPTASAQAAVCADGSSPIADRNVSMQGKAYLPRCIAVIEGTTVVWTNKDASPDGVHSVTADADQEMTFNKDPILTKEFAGTGLEKASVTFNDVGTFTYHCKYHANMKGEVVVVDTFELPTVGVDATDDLEFDPDLVEINETQTVVWTNTGAFVHDVVFEDDAVGDLGDVSPGASVNATFGAAGSYRYRCTYHSSDFEDGMVGKVAVGPAAAFPPSVAITDPGEGDVVAGDTLVSGTVEEGLGGVAATSVEVRIDTGAWTPANVGDVDGGAAPWSFAWDTSVVPDGLHTVYARAQSAEFPDPDAVSVGVTVNNEGGTDTTATHTTGTEDDDGGSGPGFEALGILAAAGAAVALLRRRR